VGHLPAEQALIPRILWTLALLLVSSLVTRSEKRIWPADRRAWRWAWVAALLLATNWVLFIYAVQTEQVLATSLGYYINPLMSILLGLVVLGERLNRAQSLSVGVAALGVAALTLLEGRLPWISLALATSFALYGLIHKLHPQPTLAGLTREMLVLAPLALAALGWLGTQEQAALLEASAREHALLALSGLVTAAPLLLFHAATRRLPLIAVGMFQYLAPTLTLGLATLYYAEPFTSSHAGAFGMVWLGLILFSVDSVRRAAGTLRTRAPRNGT
jgi:chloramphenicol-sensitive protein RarD